MSTYQKILNTKIIINTDVDLTPNGKRSAKIVRSRRGMKLPFPVIAWYVSGRFYKHSMDIDKTNEWLQAQKNK